MCQKNIKFELNAAVYTGSRCSHINQCKTFGKVAVLRFGPEPLLCQLDFMHTMQDLYLSAPQYLRTYAAISERFRDKELILKRYINSPFLLYILYNVAAARTWNSLPLHDTSAPSLPIFKRQLKTTLFTRSYLDCAALA